MFSMLRVSSIWVALQTRAHALQFSKVLTTSYYFTFLSLYSFMLSDWPLQSLDLATPGLDLTNKDCMAGKVVLLYLAIFNSETKRHLIFFWGQSAQKPECGHLTSHPLDEEVGNYLFIIWLLHPKHQFMSTKSLNITLPYLHFSGSPLINIIRFSTNSNTLSSNMHYSPNVNQLMQNACPPPPHHPPNPQSAPVST